MLRDGVCRIVEIPRKEPEPSGGGCLIATAAYGTELASEIQNLREIRDRLYWTWAGEAMRAINDFYYSFSPTVADWERENAVFREAVRVIITPSMLSFAALDHEAFSGEHLIAYVAGIVMLNVGMYIAVPAAIAMAARSLLRGTHANLKGGFSYRKQRISWKRLVWTHDESGHRASSKVGDTGDTASRNINQGDGYEL